MNDDEMERMLLESQRESLRMVVKLGREQKWWEVGNAVAWMVILVVLAFVRAWPLFITMAGWATSVFLLAPQANKRARRGGWSEAWSQAFHLAMKREVPLEVGMEMMSTMVVGMPSDKAKLDEARLSLRAVEEELGDG